MATYIRRIVGKNKRRYVQDGFDLDLAYITPRIIATGWPAEGGEVLYRNPLSELARFLSTFHPGAAKVYNLCSERCYSPAKLGDGVALLHLGFDDHQTPSLSMVQQFCCDATAWLSACPANVVVVHCKAGKGRTGVMTCCLLLHLRLVDPSLVNFDLRGFEAAACAADAGGGVGGREALASAGAAARALALLCVDLPALGGGPEGDVVGDVLDLYARRRTHDGNGVTIPSQRRYVAYFWRVLSEGRPPPRAALLLSRITVRGLPPGTAASCSVVVSCRPSDSCVWAPPTVGEFHAPQALAGSAAAGCIAPCVAPGAADHSGGVGGASLGSVRVGPAGDVLVVELGRGGGGGGGGCVEGEHGTERLILEGDVRIQVFKGGPSGQRLAYTWFHTGFVRPSGQLVLSRAQLDKVSKSLGGRFQICVDYEAAASPGGGAPVRPRTPPLARAAPLAGASDDGAWPAPLDAHSPPMARRARRSDASGWARPPLSGPCEERVRKVSDASDGGAGAAPREGGAASPYQRSHSIELPLLPLRGAGAARGVDPPAARAVSPPTAKRRLPGLHPLRLPARPARAPPAQPTMGCSGQEEDGEVACEEGDLCALLQALPLGGRPAQRGAASGTLGGGRKAASAPTTPQSAASGVRRVASALMRASGAGTAAAAAEQLPRASSLSAGPSPDTSPAWAPLLGEPDALPARLDLDDVAPADALCRARDAGAAKTAGAAPAAAPPAPPECGSADAGAGGSCVDQRTVAEPHTHSAPLAVGSWGLRGLGGGAAAANALADLRSGGWMAKGTSARAPAHAAGPAPALEWQRLEEAWHRQLWV